MMLVLLLVVAIAAAALAINWTYLVTAFQHMQQTADTIGLAATPQLLDDVLLCDLPCADDVDEAMVVQMVASSYRELANSHASSRLQLQDADVTCTLGRIDDTRKRVDDFAFETTTPFNALRTVVRRASDGANPLAHLIGGFVSVDPATVTAASYAIMDNQVVGFCPRTNVPSPVIPLAVEQAAFAARTSDSNGNGILEFELVLNSSDPAVGDDASGALIEMRDATVDIARVQSLVVAGGVTKTDLPDGKLGPVGSGPTVDYSSNPTSIGLPADQDSPAEPAIESLVAALQTIAASDDPKRIFPIYTTVAGGEAQIVEFVAARILAAEDEAEGGMADYQRLKITIEPCYLIHTTVWTKTDAEPRNLTVRKLRLIR